MTLLVAEFKNKREANQAALLISKMKKKPVRLISGKKWDDFYFAQLIDEAMKEKGEIRLSEIRKLLLR